MIINHVSWTCPGCGTTELVEVPSIRDFPEVIAHYRLIAERRHSLRVCMYARALKAAA